MHRRSVLGGVALLATGSATAFGTGAFSSVEAERSVAVEIAGDGSGYLAIRKAADTESDPGANAEAYVDTSGETVALDFSSANNTPNIGDGFNLNSVTRIHDLLELQNQGPQSVFISVDLAGMGFIDPDGNNPYVGLAVKTGPHADSYENENIVFNSIVDNTWGGVVPDPREDGAYELDAGESVNLDLTVDTSPVGEPIALPPGTSLSVLAEQESSL